MVSMDELVDKVRHTVGVKKSVALILNSVVERIAEITDSAGEAPADRVRNLDDIREYVLVILNNADVLGGAVAENQRQSPKAEHKYKKRAKGGK